MKCTVELDGTDLILTAPHGRQLRIPLRRGLSEVPWDEPENDLALLWRRRAQIAEAGLYALQRILEHAEVHEHQPVAYPTQHVLDALLRSKPIDWTAREPVVRRTVVGDATQPARKPRPSKRIRERYEPGKIDLSKVKFTL